MARVTTEQICAAWQDAEGYAGCRISLMRPTDLDAADGWATWIDFAGDDAENGFRCTPQDAREIAAELLRLADAHDAKAGA
jgi:hypothetical protein